MGGSADGTGLGRSRAPIAPGTGRTLAPSPCELGPRTTEARAPKKESRFAVWGGLLNLHKQVEPL